MTTHVIQLRNALLKRKAVEAATGVSRSHMYALIARGEFPPPVRLSARAVAWDSQAVQQWIDSRVSAAQAA